MKKLIERIKIFWSMWTVLFIIFCIVSLMITGKINKDALSIPIIIIIAIAFIIISPEDGTAGMRDGEKRHPGPAPGI